MPDSTPSSTGSAEFSVRDRPRWWSRLGLAICAAVILLWTLRPGSGGSFQRVPIVPDPVPAWAITNVHGGMLASSDFRDRILVVNFWATWCPPCIRELPDLKAFHLANSNRPVSVIGVSVDEGGTDVVRDFVDRNALGYPVGLVTESMAGAFRASGTIPATYVIDRQGRFAAHYLGALTRQELERITAVLLHAADQTNRPVATP